MLLVSPSLDAGTTLLVAELARMGVGGARSVLVVSFRQAAPRASDAEGGTMARLLQASSLQALAAPEEGGFSRLVVEVSREESPAGEDFKALFEKVKGAGYGLVLVEAPTHRGDMLYLQIVPHVDHVVLVAGYDLTNRHSLARMGELVRRQQGRLSGCILNYRQDVIPESIYRRIF